MRIFELTQSKISKVAGDSAEIDHGDGTKTVVDLKKNPSALTKDPASGKVKMNKGNKPGAAGQKPENKIKPGDQIEIEQ